MDRILFFGDILSTEEKIGAQTVRSIEILLSELTKCPENILPLEPTPWTADSVLPEHVQMQGPNRHRSSLSKWSPAKIHKPSQATEEKDIENVAMSQDGFTEIIEKKGKIEKKGNFFSKMARFYDCHDIKSEETHQLSSLRLISLPCSLIKK